MISNKMLTLKILGHRKGRNISELLNHLNASLIVEKARLMRLSSINRYSMKIRIRAVSSTN